MELIGEGEHGKVYDRGDGTVVKVMNDDSEWSISEVLKGLELEYVANYINNDLVSDSEIIIIKEKIEPLTEAKIIILKSLETVWDNCLTHKSNLWDYLSEYLKDENIPPLTLLLKYPIQKFLEHPIHFHAPFLELFMLVEELKLHGIYNIDWNPSNFGLKNNHLALFELGGARIH